MASLLHKELDSLCLPGMKFIWYDDYTRLMDVYFQLPVGWAICRLKKGVQIEIINKPPLLVEGQVIYAKSDMFIKIMTLSHTSIHYFQTFGQQEYIKQIFQFNYSDLYWMNHKIRKLINSTKQQNQIYFFLHTMFEKLYLNHITLLPIVINSIKIPKLIMLIDALCTLWYGEMIPLDIIGLLSEFYDASALNITYFKRRNAIIVPLRLAFHFCLGEFNKTCCYLDIGNHVCGCGCCINKYYNCHCTSASNYSPHYCCSFPLSSLNMEYSLLTSRGTWREKYIETDYYRRYHFFLALFG